MPADRRVLRSSTSQEQQETAILAAAAEEFADVGIQRASTEDIARRAGVSRSTLYRRFPSKEDLVTTLGETLTRQFFTQLAEAINGLNPREAVVEAFGVAMQSIGRDPLMQRLFEEPEALDLLMGAQSPDKDNAVSRYSAAIARSLRSAGASMPDKDLAIVAEMQFRLLVSLTQSPTTTLDIDDDASIKDFVERFLAPMVW